MCVARLMLVGSLLVLTAVGAAQVAPAAEEITLRAGEASGPNAVFAFDEDASPHKVVVRTNQVGAARSRIEVTIDKLKKPVFSHIFTPDECKFGDAGSKCETIQPRCQPCLAVRFSFGRGIAIAPPTAPSPIAPERNPVKTGASGVKGGRAALTLRDTALRYCSPAILNGKAVPTEIMASLMRRCAA
jgi:hypothetical protein